MELGKLMRGTSTEERMEKERRAKAMRNGKQCERDEKANMNA
jgi:hypothetical protein